MLRRRKTWDELQRSGALKKNPGRYLHLERVPICTDSLGPPPIGFTPELLQAWDEVVEATRAVKLCSADRLHVEMTARLLARTRILGCSPSIFGLLQLSMTKFGLPDSTLKSSEQTKDTDREDWESIAASAPVKFRKN